MNLSLLTGQSNLEATATCPTVVSPGNDILVTILIRANSPVEIRSLTWLTPDDIVRDVSDPALPIVVAPNQPLDYTQIFKTTPGTETSGVIEVEMDFRDLTSDTDHTLKWKHWISVFERVTEDDPTGLSAASRKRLIDVVNARLINAYLYMADFIRFFEHYLHVEIPDWLATRISKELSLIQEPLPVDEETFIRIATGQLDYYGIEEFELIAEEECEESDDRFDPDQNMEVEHPDIEIA